MPDPSGANNRFFVNISPAHLLRMEQNGIMSKKICKERDKLAKKVKGSKKRYICAKCGGKSPKEKWVCKAVENKQ